MGSLTDVQRSIVIGKLLGDGSLRKKANTLLEINHSYKQKDYVFWLYDVFREHVLTPPELRVSGIKRFSYRFTTRSLSDLNSFYKEFYPNNGTKIVSKTLKLDPLSLAIWFMDDGSKTRTSVYLNTQQFCIEDQQLLLVKLKELGIVASLNKDKSYFRIRLAGSSVNTFTEYVKPNLLPSMEYKLP